MPNYPNSYYSGGSTLIRTSFSLNSFRLIKKNIKKKKPNGTVELSTLDPKQLEAIHNCFNIKGYSEVTGTLRKSNRSVLAITRAGNG